MVWDSSWLMVRLYSHYKLGRYPQNGGMLEQNNAYLQAMGVIEDAVAKVEQERVEQSRRKG